MPTTTGISFLFIYQIISSVFISSKLSYMKDKDWKCGLWYQEFEKFVHISYWLLSDCYNIFQASTILQYQCCVPHCERWLTVADGIEGFKFPFVDPRLLQRWINAMPCDEDWKPTENSTVCWNHFHQNDFYVADSGTMDHIYYYWYISIVRLLM